MKKHTDLFHVSMTLGNIWTIWPLASSKQNETIDIYMNIARFKNFPNTPNILQAPRPSSLLCFFPNQGSLWYALLQCYQARGSLVRQDMVWNQMELGGCIQMKIANKAWKCFLCLHFPAVSLLCFILRLLWQDCGEVCPHSEDNSLCLFEAPISFLTSLTMSWKMLLLCCQLSDFLENIPWLNGATPLEEALPVKAGPTAWSFCLVE